MPTFLAADATRVHTLSDFDFALPPELIAQHPAVQRSASRLLDGRGDAPVDRIFHELPALLRQGDLLILNDTRVVKARLFGEKPSGGRVELLVERVLGGNQVAAHMRVSKKPAVGTTLTLSRERRPAPKLSGIPRGELAKPQLGAPALASDSDDTLRATLLGRWPDADGALFRFVLSNDAGDDPYTLMERHGHVPLPPYIDHADEHEDVERYQTVFARHAGAVAAPTAALHFDQDLLDALDARGIARAFVTLHVGAGTFQPVKTERIAEHRMHSEWYQIPAQTVQAIADCRARGGRIVAVGTTCVRTLESWARSGQTEGDTDIFITPGFEFRVVDLLVTNFHLPRSTLMMLVSAFAGYEAIRSLYAHAIAQRYRFFSYGDAMLLQRRGADRSAAPNDPPAARPNI